MFKKITILVLSIIISQLLKSAISPWKGGRKGGTIPHSAKQDRLLRIKNHVAVTPSLCDGWEYAGRKATTGYPLYQFIEKGCLKYQAAQTGFEDVELPHGVIEKQPSWAIETWGEFAEIVGPFPAIDMALRTGAIKWEHRTPNISEKDDSIPFNGEA